MIAKLFVELLADLKSYSAPIFLPSVSLFPISLLFTALSLPVHAQSSLDSAPVQVQTQNSALTSSPNCNTVRFADIGWTDTTASTALASSILNTLGYSVTTTQLSVPITYLSLKESETDVFLGNWMPVMAEGIHPYIADHSIEIMGTLLKGAKSTLAVPYYVHLAGVNSIEDLAKFSEKFNKRIYGIEAGSNGNRKIQDIISQDDFELGNWTLSESSEQGMLTEVQRAVNSNGWIVFLAWEPHPMNNKFRLYYLKGTENYFGKNQGESTVYSVSRRNYSKECPEMARFFSNFTLDIKIESELMDLILNQGLAPSVAAERWLRSHIEHIKPWLSGLHTTRGAQAYPFLKQALSSAGRIPSSARFLCFLPKLPLGFWIQEGVLKITARFEPLFRQFSNGTTYVLEGVIDLMLWFSPWVLILMIGSGFYFATRNLKDAVVISSILLLIWDLGYWVEMIETVLLVVSSTVISVILGTPIGIFCAHHKKTNQLIQPVLDFMQTIPTFVYLIPTLMLLGLGLAPALVSTVVFVLPTSIRLTYHGIKSVPLILIEAGEAFGATLLQRIIYIEIPYALGTIRMSISQAMMLSLSMVVIAALVGAEGLGKSVIQSLSTVNIAQGFEAGLVIVLLSILFNRILRVNAKVTRSSGEAI